MKKSVKMSAKKTAAPKKKAKPKKPASKKAMTKKSTAGKVSNRRKFRRYPASNLWVTELSGDYQFTANASDISEGGIFLKSRLKTTSAASQLTLHLGSQGSLEVMAKPVHDRIASGTYGAGYEFMSMSATQMKTLRGFLRNLD
ncbi:MAG: PilZ domain-containing protein [Deltaproteobacteria bacterium]|nr:PilZ domain-containing protein [Deltaproteobacteria bacterium]